MVACGLLRDREEPCTSTGRNSHSCREEVEAGETQLFMDTGRPLREVGLPGVVIGFAEPTSGPPNASY